jgi:hypothetical protein
VWTRLRTWLSQLGLPGAEIAPPPLLSPLPRLLEGWDETYLQYFNGNGPIHGRNVSFILEQVVQGLLANPKRRFTYVEQAFFQLWYETQTPALQAQVQGLVKSRQLVFQNGGWSMHDEANPSYVDMLDK